jgi:hypothetical protein
MKYKNLAAEKFMQIRNEIVNDTKTLEDFIAFCYLKYRPNEYGKKIQKRLERYFGMHKVSDSIERGDSFYSTMGDHKMWFEMKVSYLGKTDTYSIRYIRHWQDLDYYLLCFVDPRDCKPQFYVVTGSDLMKNFKCHFMNGTKESNKSNKKSALGLMIKNGSKNHELLKRLNKLQGTDTINVFEFLAEQKVKVS